VLVWLSVLGSSAAVAARRTFEHVWEDRSESQWRHSSLEREVDHHPRDRANPAHAGEPEQALKDEADGDDDLPTGSCN
jgi:hypothetical protein